MPRFDANDLAGAARSLSCAAFELLLHLHHRDDFTGRISSHDAEALSSAAGLSLDQLMAALVPVAALYALPATSGYSVGAVAEGASGSLYFGANLEFSGAPINCTIHAEQAALANAWSNRETGLRSLALSAAPCGYCRQFLYELTASGSLRISVPGRPPVLLSQLLPDAFGPQDLGVIGGLLSPVTRRLEIVGRHEDRLLSAALESAAISYAPYTCGWTGAALLLSDGRIVSASYAENAAFNPSLFAMPSALSQLRFYNQSATKVLRAGLVEVAGARTSQRELSRSVLAVHTPSIKLEEWTAQAAV